MGGVKTGGSLEKGNWKGERSKTVWVQRVSRGRKEVARSRKYTFGVDCGKHQICGNCKTFTGTPEADTDMKRAWPPSPGGSKRVDGTLLSDVRVCLRMHVYKGGAPCNRIST